MLNEAMQVLYGDPEDPKSVNPKPAELEAVDPKPADPKPAEPEAVDPETLAALDESKEHREDAPDSPIDLELLAKALKFDRDALSVRDGVVQVRAKVDGEAFDTSLGDLVKGYQTEAHVTRKSQALADERKKWEQETADQRTAFEQQAAVVAQLLKADEERIQKEYEKVPWEQLRGEDPARYAAVQTDYQRAFTELQQRRAQAAEAVQTLQAQQIQRQQEHMRKVASEELHVLTEKLGWTQQDLPAKQKELRTYLSRDIGYPDEQLSQVYEHRFLVLADKARRWDNLQAKVAKIRKDKADPAKPVKSIPSATVSSPRSPTRSSRTKALIDRARATGRLSDQTSAAVAILTEG